MIISDKWIDLQKSKNIASPCGNGKCVPVYDFDKRSNKLFLKKDKNGEVVTKSLYDDIQSFRNFNNIQSMLNKARKSGSNLDQFELDSYKMTKDQGGFDFSDFGTFDDFTKAQQNLESRGFKDFNDLFSKYVDLRKKVVEQQKKLSAIEKFNKKNDEVKK